MGEKTIKKRVFNISQMLEHPTTGEKLVDIEEIKYALERYKTLGRWAWVIHDKDVYSQEEEDDHLHRLKMQYKKTDGEHSEEGLQAFIEKNRYVFCGRPKHPHIHIVINSKTSIDANLVSKWLGIPLNFIDFPKGKGAFLDCVEYLTHETEKEQGKGKFYYSDSDIHSNFDFRMELLERVEKKQRYGQDVDQKTAMFYDVRYNGKTLRECIAEDKVLYLDIFEKLKRLRLEYISSLKPPATRINYYIEGQGGIGKGLICRAIARSLFPDMIDDEDIFFEVGAKGAAFEGYDGQPVIIWNDRRAFDLLEELNGRGNVFNVFDTHPTKQKQNIKYGSINLCNVVNIVNSVQPFNEFLDGLAGEYKDKNGKLIKSEDKSQSYRRFPFIIPLHEDDFDMLLNKGFMDNTRQYLDYYEYRGIRGNMERIVVRCKGNEELARRLESQTVKPIADKHQEVLAKATVEIDEAAILAEFADYGKMPDTVEQTSFIEESSYEELSDEEAEELPAGW